jgi:hypothetical protein
MSSDGKRKIISTSNTYQDYFQNFCMENKGQLFQQTTEHSDQP